MNVKNTDWHQPNYSGPGRAVCNWQCISIYHVVQHVDCHGNVQKAFERVIEKHSLPVALLPCCRPPALLLAVISTQMVQSWECLVAAALGEHNLCMLLMAPKGFSGFGYNMHWSVWYVKHS